MVEFNEVFIDTTKYVRKIKKSEYLNKGKHPIIDQGQEFVVGFTNDENGIFNGVPAIIFGDHTRIIKYIDKPFFIGADGVKVLKSKIDDIEYKYLYYALRNINIVNTGYNRHFKWLKESKFILPNRVTQKEIVSILDGIENLIYLKNQQLSAYDQLIKSRFVEMFGDPVLNPKDWNTDKLQNVCAVNKYKGEVESINGKVWLLNLDMVESNTGKIIDYVYEDESNVASSTIKFDSHCVLYSKLRPYLNKVVVPLKSGYATSEMISMKSDRINKYFLSNILMMNSFVDFANGTAYGAKMPRASIDMIKNFDLILPPIDLQNEFSDFVQQIDKLKFSVQKSLEETQILFDSLMQKYFG